MDRFFLESIGLPYDSVVDNISSSWVGEAEPPLPRFENLIIKVTLLLNDISPLTFRPLLVDERNDLILLVQSPAQTAVPNEINIRVACSPRRVRSPPRTDYVFGIARVPPSYSRTFPTKLTSASKIHGFSDYFPICP